MYSKLFSESLIMMREALDCPTMDNKQNTMVKTAHSISSDPGEVLNHNTYQSFISSIEIT